LILPKGLHEKHIQKYLFRLFLMHNDIPVPKSFISMTQIRVYITMRILHITTEYFPFVNGGLAVAVTGLAAACRQAGLEVEVIHIRKIEKSVRSKSQSAEQYTVCKGAIVSPKVIDAFELSYSIEQCIEMIQCLA
jgi:hypothetical protein